MFTLAVPASIDKLIIKFCYFLERLLEMQIKQIIMNIFAKGKHTLLCLSLLT